jgi:catechol 2,3-dioxygenase-like lactoylglutathione lyase family enzyme
MSERSLGTTKVMQVGIIVSDIEAKVEAWSALLGVPAPPVVVTDPVEVAQTEYQGQRTPARAKLAFFQLGQVTLELIEPMGEPSTWNDQLAAHGESLHHIAFEVSGMGERLAALEAQGIPLLQRGEYSGGRYAYVDGNERLGAVVELLENE